MTDARGQILGGIRKALKRDALPAHVRRELEELLARHPRNLVPARAAGRPPGELVALFTQMAEAVAATVERLDDAADVPAAAARWLASHNLPAELRLAPDPALTALPWDERPALMVRSGRAEDADLTSLTGAVAGIAETGTLMLVSGPESPTTLNLMPDNHIVVLHADRIVGTYEDAWDIVRARAAAGAGLPRTINLITGPSRTGDIEQTIQLGAHGPRRLHILLIGGGAGADRR